MKRSLQHGALILLAATQIITTSAIAQTAPATPPTSAAAAPPAPDDKPSIKVGVLLFADYTDTQEPKIVDADGNRVSGTAFNISRAYLNVTGNLNHLLAFRITPDIVRETGTGSALNGSYTFRLKFAYGQFNLDDWAGKGSWVRLGLQPTPYNEYLESVYRYRFQGQIFVDREGFIGASDAGVSGHYNLPAEYGDLQLGYFNGEGFQKSDPNDQKAIMVRVGLRPFPRAANLLKGIRAGGFIDGDDYVRGNPRRRAVAFALFESRPLNAGLEVLKATDQPTSASPKVDARGYSVWATPKTSFGLEALLRHDELTPNEDQDGRKKRNIIGIAYWFQHLQGVKSAVLLDYEGVAYDDLPGHPDERRLALHMLVSY